MVGRDHQNGIHIFAGQNLTVIPRCVDLLAESRPRVFEPPGVEIGHGHQFHIRVAQSRLGVEVPLNPHADGGNPDLVVGADLFQITNNIEWL